MVNENYPLVIAAAIIGDDGIVYHLDRPARHHDVGLDMVFNKGHPAPYPLRTQGFILSDGTFADRVYARICAEKNNQLLPTASKLRELYSEDVW